jgi:RHS repeat-associated protein
LGRAWRLLLLGAIIAAAVSAPAQDYLNAVGTPAFTAADPFELGFVNLANGDLHLDVPMMAAPPQRGKLQYTDNVFSYDSRIWSIFTDVTGNQFWTMNQGGWGWATPSVATAMIEYSFVNCANGFDSGYSGVPAGFSYVEANATVHTFSSILPQLNIQPCATPTMASTVILAWADDFSHYAMYVDTTGIEMIVKVYAPDGTLLYPIMEDTNGNYFSAYRGPAMTASATVDTLGRTPLVTDTTLGFGGYDVLTSNGSEPITTSYESLSVSTDFGQTNVGEWPYSGTPVKRIAGFNLPDGSQYAFGYDSYGELNSITLPTGGQITLTYQNITDYWGNVNRWVSFRTSPAGTWTYSYAFSSTGGLQNNNGPTMTTTVTRPDGSRAVYLFDLANIVSSSGSSRKTVQTTLGHAPWNTTISIYDPSNNLLATKTNTYNYAAEGHSEYSVTGAGALLSSVNIVYPSSVANTGSYTEYDYSNGCDSLLSGIKEWPFAQQSFITSSYPAGRTTTLQYVYQPPNCPTASSSPPMVSEVAAIKVQDSSGNGSETDYTYDNYGAGGLTSYGTGGLAGVLRFPNHDDENFGPGNTSRGNVTSISRAVGAGANPLVTGLGYDIAGDLVSSTDPAGNVTKYDYGPENAAPIEIQSPAGLMEMTYYYNTGKLASLLPAYSWQHWYFYYNDPLDRLTKVTQPDDGGPSYVYTGSNQVDSAMGIGYGNPARYDRTALDSLGRTQTQSLLSDPDGRTNVDYSYNTVADTVCTSNPHRSVPSSTDGATCVQYDPIGRVTRILRQDGNSVTYQYGASVGGAAAICNNGTGYPSFSTDETGRQRQFWTSGYGEVIETDEPDSSGAPSIATCYGYDVLGNLTSVQQQGGSTSSSLWRNWAMHYDGLSRLTSATSPEAGTTSYSYVNASGGLCSGDASLPCTRTDARGIVTTYGYDSANQLTSVAYSDNQTPRITYNYGNSPLLQSMTDGSGTTYWQYDAMARVTETWLQPPGSAYSFPTSFSTYNFDGSLATQDQNLTYSYNGAQEPVAVSGGANQYVSQAHYTPTGQLASVGLGGPPGAGDPAITETVSWNNRLQPTRIKAVANAGSAGTLFDISYSYDQGGGRNNGNVAWTTNNLECSRSAGYTYDNLNRLTSAISTNWGDAYGYDAWGNLLSMTPCGSVNAAGACLDEGSSSLVGQTLNVQVGSNNQITNDGVLYDSAGNMTTDISGNKLTFNGRNQLTSFLSPGSSAMSYVYNGAGQRAQKSDGTHYYYNSNGSVSSVGDGLGNAAMSYVYFNGARVADVNSAGAVRYYLTDRLGSTSTLTDGQQVLWQGDYYPFGSLVSGTPERFGFTGYEFDSESGYNYAVNRYQSPLLGRFLSADPLPGSVGSPQSWNRYAYVRNNPLNLTDPSGAMVQYQYPGQGGFGAGGGFDPFAGIGDFGGGEGGDEGGEGEDGPNVTEEPLGPTPNPDTQVIVLPITFYVNVLGQLPGPGQDPPAGFQASAPVFPWIPIPVSFGSGGGGGGGGGGAQRPTNKTQPSKQLQCAGQALRNNGASIALDVLGAIPGLGNVVSAGAAGGRVVDGILSLAGGTYGVATGATGQDPAGAAAAGTGVGLALAGAAMGGRVIPVVGNAFSVVTGAYDSYQAYQTYQQCMAGH